MVDGFLIETIEPGSPAHQAGLQGGGLSITIAGTEFLLGGDIITDLNGQSLNDVEKFAELIRSLKVGDKIHLTLYHEKKTRKVEFILPERPTLPRDLRPGSSGNLSPI